MSDTVAPKRYLEVTITLGADDHQAAIRALGNYVQMAEREYGGKLFGTVSGGYDSGYSVVVMEHPEQTHDRYVEQLTAYLDATREPA